MSIPKMRPTFLLTVDLTRDQVIDRLRGLIESSDGRFTGKLVGRHVMLTVSDKDRHFWSPWLDMEVIEPEENETGGAVAVRGRFTPHPNIWTGFAFSYFSLIVIACFAGVWGMSQRMLQQKPTALWVGLVCVLIVGLLWWAAQMGQRLAREQMRTIKDAVQETISPQ